MGPGHSIDILLQGVAWWGRLLSFFLLSPLLAKKGIPLSVRLGTSFAVTLVMLPTLSATHSIESRTPVSWLGEISIEILIGYFLGFLFSMLFEGAAFAGEVIGILMGISFTELLDPLSPTRYPLLGRFLLLALFALFLLLDLHHVLLRILTLPRNALPPTLLFWQKEGIEVAIQASTSLFHALLHFTLLPLFSLLSLIVIGVLFSRLFSSLVWITLPIQLLVGFTTLGASFYILPWALSKAFSQLERLLFSNL